MKLLVPMFAALMLTACGPKSTPPPPPGPTAGLGQAGEVNGLRFRPLEVVEDSRCPARGVVLHLGVGKPGGGEEMRIDVTLGQPVSIYGGTLTMVNVEPPKGTLPSLAREAYRFTFTYSR